MKIIFASISDYQLLYDSNNIPLGLLSLATVIKKTSSHEALVIDFNCLYRKEFKISDVLWDNINRDASYLLSKQPDVVSIYTMCNNFHIALLLAEKIKSENHKVKVLLGGPQATTVAEKTLEKYPFIDGIGLGEGENTIVGILDGLEKGDFSQSFGFAYRDNGKVILHNNDTLIQNLDEIPIIDLSLYPYQIGDSITMDVGRGCPYSCIFCSTKLFWKRKFRIKSAKRIYEEILYFKNNHGVKKFSFEHDLFVANRKLVIELSKLLIENKTDITWACSARVDTIDDELLSIMKASGCKNIYFGIESGSEKTQKYIKKNLDLKQVEKLPELLKKHKLQGTLSFIYGFPEETKEDIDETLMFIYKMIDKHHNMITNKQIDIQLHKLMFLPKTELTERHKYELVHKEGYTMEVLPSLECWSDKKLLEMIKDVELFPFLSCIPDSNLEKIPDLNKFFTYILIPSIPLFDVTYKLLLKEMKGSLLKVSEVFHTMLKNELDEFYTNYLKELNKKKLKNEMIIIMLEKLIENYNFTIIDVEAIRNMFYFERDIYLQLYKNKEDKKEINIQKEYQYDVIQMRKNRSTQYDKKTITVRFFTEDGKYIMRKVEMENALFALISTKKQSDIQASF